MLNVKGKIIKLIEYNIEAITIQENIFDYTKIKSSLKQKKLLKRAKPIHVVFL